MVIHKRVSSFLASFLLLVLFVLPALTVARGGQTTSTTALTNDDVIKMVQAKLPDGVIVAKIKSSACGFDTGTDALIKLKQEGVSEPVLAAMAGCASPAPVGTPPALNDPDADHPSGIYYLQQRPNGPSMTELEPTVYSGGKSGGFWKTRMTYGIAKSKWTSVVHGGRAALRITEARPTFYFYFDVKNSGLSTSGTWGMGASSADEFLLAKMEEKKDEREVIMGQVNAFGASMGTSSKEVISFDAQKIRPGVYKVQPRTDLDSGEYCFYYGGSAQAMGATGGKLFDFGINPAE
ncbi:MAG TPA: hypothetical protein VG028_20595 [Terriglobia bacterium]|nr:hypothetical protein [Terriglobia bacterium]